MFFTAEPETVAKEGGIAAQELVFKGQSCKRVRLEIDVD
jgi:hypothetical protein